MTADVLPMDVILRFGVEGSLLLGFGVSGFTALLGPLFYHKATEEIFSPF